MGDQLFEFASRSQELKDAIKTLNVTTDHITILDLLDADAAKKLVKLSKVD